jgi:hypothetical protein
MLFQKRADPAPRPRLPRPIALAPSGFLESSDGKWCTFDISKSSCANRVLGNHRLCVLIDIAGDGEGKGQNFRILPSTSLPIALVPAQAEWCNDEDCWKSRGIGSFNGQQPPGLDISSPMWEQGSLYGLPFNTTYWWSQSLLTSDTNTTLSGDWGLTTVGLGQASSQSITVPEQWVAMSTLEDFPLGYLGLSVGGISPTGATRPTFLSGLAESDNFSTIPSSAYGFTAGASYSKLSSKSPFSLLSSGS